MKRTRIKICGITRLEDALAAADAGADAIGMVFHPAAPRCISRELAGQILAALPPFVTPVGLFVDVSSAQVRATAEVLGLRCVQLHGHETPEMVADLRGFCVLKAVRVTPQGFASDLRAWHTVIQQHGMYQLRGLVLETGGGKQAGGTGVENDWPTIIETRRTLHLNLPPLIAAGGLHPGNVGRVVREIRPWAVDVSSGVESSPGIKSAEKMRAFISAVREADAST